MDPVAQITLHDGLAFSSGFVAPADYACVIYCRVPPNWIEAGQLKSQLLEAIFESLYGPGWRQGNEDGSQYVVRSVESRLLTPAEVEAAPWRTAHNDNAYHYWFYHASADGQLQAVESAEL